MPRTAKLLTEGLIVLALAVPIVAASCQKQASVQTAPVPASKLTHREPNDKAALKKLSKPPARQKTCSPNYYWLGERTIITMDIVIPEKAPRTEEKGSTPQ